MKQLIYICLLLASFSISFIASYFFNGHKSEESTISKSPLNQSTSFKKTIPSPLNKTVETSDQKLSKTNGSPWQWNTLSEQNAYNLISMAESFELHLKIFNVEAYDYFSKHPDILVDAMNERFKKKYRDIKEIDNHHHTKLVSEISARMGLLTFWQSININPQIRNNFYRTLLINPDESWVVKRRVLQHAQLVGLNLSPKDRKYILANIDRRSIASLEMTDNALIEKVITKGGK